MNQLLASMEPENFQRISIIRVGEHGDVQTSIASVGPCSDLATASASVSPFSFTFAVSFSNILQNSGQGSVQSALTGVLTSLFCCEMHHN
jgi:hypothetical protein